MHAAPQQAAIRRDRLISLDMGEVAQELAQEKERARPGGIASRALSSGANAASEHLARCAASCHFACTCCIGALHSMAPPTLAAAEAACMLAVYLAAVPNAFPTRTARVHYTFAGSAEDVVVLSLLRCAAVTLAHCLGTGPLFQRPYRLTAFLFCSASLPLGLMKLVALVKHSQWPRRQWPPFIALFALHMAFAALQVLAAQRIVTWARKRWEHGLGGLGLPWQEGEDAWLLAGQLQSRTEEGSGAQACPGEHDLPPDALADPDSRWAHCGALRVHYKLALPLGCRGTTAGAGLVLVHSFGGGTFAWRHVMQPLADACGLPVLAFDRPGFGLTDRPVVPPGASVDSNPYSLKSQALLALDLASSLGLRNVVLGGHGDGALLALMSAAMAAREAALGSSPPPSPAPFDGSDRGCDGRQGAMPVAAQGSVNVAGGRRRQLSGGSIPDSLDWAWMSSQPDSGPSSLLQHLLRGEWPASIEPRPGTGASVGPPLSGWASGQSPLRPPRRWGRRGAETPLPQPLPQCAEDEAGPEEGQEQLEGIIPEQEGLQQEQQVLADAELQPQLLVQQVQQASSGQVPAAVGTQRDTAAELGSDAGEMRHWPAPAGLILLHPDLSGNVAPNYARVLAHSRLGRRVLRSLLRTEVGEVTNRRAWADPHRLTPGLLALYRRPLSIEGWDLALTEVARVRNHIASLERRQLLGAVVQAGLPVLVATGESDHVSPPGAAARLAEQLGAAGPRLAVLPACGHLSHEEAPQELLDFLQSFLLEQGLGRPQL